MIDCFARNSIFGFVGEHLNQLYILIDKSIHMIELHVSGHNHTHVIALEQFDFNDYKIISIYV